MGRPVTVTISHEKGVEAAKEKIDNQFDELKNSIAAGMALQFDRHWEGDTMKFTAKGMGQKVPGSIDVFPEHIRVTIELPMLLAGMAGALTERIEKASNRILLEDKSKS